MTDTTTPQPEPPEAWAAPPDYCTCVCINLGDWQTPSEWEQADNCPVHPAQELKPGETIHPMPKSVRLSRYRHPNVPAEIVCPGCGYTMHHHFWIDGLPGAEVVCPPEPALGSGQKPAAIQCHSCGAQEQRWSPSHRMPGSTQEPADPPWLTEAIKAHGDYYDSEYGIRMALPILRAGIAAEIEASIGNVAGESHAYCEGKRDAADIVRGQS